jgi:Na+-transporting NADH:ubiquinone oxidoreductase subunit C
VLNKSNVKALGFALAICLICSLALSFVAQTFRPLQERNVQIDTKKNILKALKISTLNNPSSSDLASFYSKINSNEVESLYDSFVRSYVIDGEGNAFYDKKVESLSDQEKSILFPVYTHVINDDIIAYAIPISGKGLWSTLYGFLALEKDLNTVKGLTFYQHGETPGLGAEIEKDWFGNNFIGKKILDETGDIASITVIKGKVDANTPKSEHKVDGISGSTMTSNGVTNLLRKDITFYNKYFEKVRSRNNG